MKQYHDVRLATMTLSKVTASILAGSGCDDDDDGFMASKVRTLGVDG